MALNAYASGCLGDHEAMMAGLKKAAAMNPAFQACLLSAEEFKDDPRTPFLFPGEQKHKKQKRRGKHGGPDRKRMIFAVGLGLFTFMIFIGVIVGLRQRALASAAPLPDAPQDPSSAPPKGPPPGPPSLHS